MLISGACVYPAPALVSINSLTEFSPPILVVIATAAAFIGLDDLDVEMNTVGVDVYPLPSFSSVNERI